MECTSGVSIEGKTFPGFAGIYRNTFKAFDRVVTEDFFFVFIKFRVTERNCEDKLTFKFVYRAIRLTLPSTICSIWEWKITRRQFLNLSDASQARVRAASIFFKCAGLTDSVVRDVVTVWVGTQEETRIVAAFVIFRSLLQLVRFSKPPGSPCNCGSEQCGT